MTYTRPGWKPVTTELNDRPRGYRADLIIQDEIESLPWDDPDSDPIADIQRAIAQVRAQGKTVWTFTKRHVDWCHDDTCPGKVASINDQAWVRHWSHRRDGGHRSSTT